MFAVSSWHEFQSEFILLEFCKFVNNGETWIDSRCCIVIVHSGRMSDCPAYLGITISSCLDLDEELFRYDALILCPTDFNLTFRVPNWAEHLEDRAFNVRLQDAIRSHSIYLTQLALEEVDSHFKRRPFFCL